MNRHLIVLTSLTALSLASLSLRAQGCSMDSAEPKPVLIAAPPVGAATCAPTFDDAPVTPDVAAPSAQAPNAISTWRAVAEAAKSAYDRYIEFLQAVAAHLQWFFRLEWLTRLL